MSEYDTANEHELCFQIGKLKRRIADLSQALGLITTLKPTMVMDANHPLDMVREVAEHVTARIAELEAENDELKERVAMLDVTAVFKSLGEMGYIEQVDRLNARIAELEGFIGKLIEAGDEMSNAQSMWVAEEDKWDALVKDWKEREE